jgi:hypothetical protein
MKKIGERQALEISYNFEELDPTYTEASEPYMSSVAQIPMLHSNRDDSACAVIGASLDKIINPGIPDTETDPTKLKGWGSVKGKLMEWKLMPGHTQWSKKAGKQMPTSMWEVIWVEGFGSAPSANPTSGVQTQANPVSGGQSAAAPTTANNLSPAIQALKLLDGKTLQNWQNEVFKVDAIKMDGPTVTAILTKAANGLPKFLEGYMAAEIVLQAGDTFILNPEKKATLGL